MPTEDPPTTEPGQEPPESGQGQSTTTDPWASPEAARAEIEKLRRENANWRTQVRDLKPLADKAKELDEATKSEVQKALDRATQAEQAAQAAQLEAARLRAASVHGLTEAQAKRLVGSTPEELEADAKEFAKELGTNGTGRRPTDLKQGARGPASVETDPNAWIRKAAGRQ
jgi:hypothetical protein